MKYIRLNDQFTLPHLEYIECPRCGEMTYWEGYCKECGYSSGD